MSDSSRHNLYSVLESVYGTTPATPALKKVRHTACNLGLSKNTIVSDEIRSDRQIADFRHGTKQTGGDISTELSFASFDDFLEACLCGTWSTPASPVSNAGISAAASDNSINYSGGTDGTAQVETATVVGTITGTGDAEVIVTAAGLTGSPLTIPVAVLDTDTASIVAGKIRDELEATAAVTALFAVSGAGAEVILTRLTPAANDATLNISIDNDTCTGLTTAATSANTTAGVATAGLPLVAVGDVIRIAGFTGTVGNNGVATVVSRTAAKIVIEGITLVDDAAGESVTVTPMAMLKAGVTRRSFTVLRDFSDITDGRYHKFAGQEVNKVVFTVAPNAIVKAVFSLIGKGLAISDDAPAGATYPSPTTSSPMDSFSGAVKLDGTVVAIITEIQATLENGINPRFVVGSDETIRPSIGRSNLTGQLALYFEDATMVGNFIDEDELELQFTLGDGAAGNAYQFTMPKIKFTGGQPDVASQGPIMLTMPYQAIYDSIVSSQIKIAKIPVAA